MSGYGDIIPYLEKKVKEYKPLTEEEQKKLRRRQRAEGIIGGISDAVRAVANLFYTTQYAPNMYNAGEGMSARAKARFDKETADRKARDDEYFNYAMTLGKMKHGAAQEEREWRHTLEREKITDKWRQDAEDRKNAKEEFDAQKRMLDLKYQQGKIDRQSYLTEQEELETEYMRKHNQKMPTTPKPSSGGGTGRGRGTGNQNRYLLLLILPLLSFMMAGCGDDEDDVIAPNLTLVAGTWQVVSQGDQKIFGWDEILHITSSQIHEGYGGYHGYITTYFLASDGTPRHDRVFTWSIREVENNQPLLDVVFQGDLDSDDRQTGIPTE